MFYLIMAPKHKSSAGNLVMPKKNNKVLLLSSWLNKERKKKWVLRLPRSMIKLNLLSVKLWRRKKMCANFAVALQTAKVLVTMHKCLANMKKALNLRVEGMNRKCVQWMAVCCTRKHWAYTKTSARDPLKQVITLTYFLLEYVVIIVLFYYYCC